MNKNILKLLEAMKEMSESEDWNESRAQELVLFGGELYDTYHLQLRGKIDDEGQH